MARLDKLATPPPAAAQPSPSAEAGAAATARVRKRRWPRRIALGLTLAVALFIALVALAPTLASTRVGTAQLLTFVNARLRGAIAVQSLSLSWFAPGEIRGLRITDSAQREVLSIEKLTLGGLWSSVASGAGIGEIAADRPTIVLLLDQASESSLAQAFQPRTPRASPAGPATLPALRGRIVIRDARVRVARESGGQYEVPDIDLSLDLDSPHRLAAQLAATLADGAGLAVDADIDRLTTDGVFRPLDAAGSISVKTSGPIDIGPAASVLVPDRGLSGALNGEIRATFDRGAGQADVALAAAQIRSTRPGAGESPPLDVTVNAKLAVAGGVVRAQGEVSGGNAGEIDVRGSGEYHQAQRSVTAELAIRADLDRALGTFCMLFGADEPRAIRGQFALNTSLATSNGIVQARGAGGVDNLEIGAGEQIVREKRLDLEFDAALDQAADTLTLARARIASAPLSAEVAGRVGQLSTTRDLALKGRYDASWESLTTLLHQLAPATAEALALRGRSASEFELAGPLRQPGQTPEFRGLCSSAQLAWSSADVLGVTLGAAALAPTLRDGQLTLPRTTIPAADGKVNIAAMLDLQPAEPMLRIPGKLQLLDRIAITRELGASLLSRINPVFLHLASIEGQASLHVTEVSLPLGEGLRTRSGGKGVLDLRSVRLQPGGLIGELLELAGVSPGGAYPVQIGRLDFELADGRIRYDNFALKFPDDLDLVFRGSVGLDESVDLVVSVPLRQALLRRLGVQASALSMLRPLSGLRVEIPIVGTREEPRLDLSKVDAEQLVRQVLLPDSPQQGVEDLLKGLGALRERADDPPREKSPPKREPAPKSKPKPRPKSEKP
jgi:hypothetical protein